MSSVTTSGRTSASASSAARPVAAVPAISFWGSLASAVVMTRRITAESSTTSTRILGTGAVGSFIGGR